MKSKVKVENMKGVGFSCYTTE